MSISTQTIFQKFTYSGSNKFDPSFFVNGNVPHVGYSGLSICQHYAIIDPFAALFQAIRPKTIIEIGTAAGGLTLLLRDILDLIDLTDTSLITYDVINSPLQTKISDKRITFFQKNLFSSDYESLIDSDFIRTQIQEVGPTIILCDGGRKSKEFNLLSPFLKLGDVIMAHDYAKDEQTFREKILNKIWYWHEIKEADIKDSCASYNLTPYMAEEFEKVVWACYKKS